MLRIFLATMLQLFLFTKVVVAEDYCVNIFAESSAPAVDFRDQLRAELQHLVSKEIDYFGAQSAEIKIVTQKLEGQEISIKTVIVVKDLVKDRSEYVFEQPGAIYVKMINSNVIMVGTVKGILIVLEYNQETGSHRKRIVRYAESAADKLFIQNSGILGNNQNIVGVRLTNGRVIRFDISHAKNQGTVIWAE